MGIIIYDNWVYLEAEPEERNHTILVCEFYWNTVLCMDAQFYSNHLWAGSCRVTSPLQGSKKHFGLQKV